MVVHETERLRALRDLRILDTPQEEIFETLTALAAQTFDVPIALISLVDDERQWFKSCIGLDTRETSRDVAFCDHAIRQDDPLVVLDAKRDERFADNPLVTDAPAIRFYAGAPLILRPGVRLGTLCIISDKARAEFSGASRRQLAAMAASVTAALAMRRDISSFQKLDQERAAKSQILAQGEALAGVGHWSWNARANTTTWSPVVYAIHGLDPSGPSPDYTQAMAVYEPPDRIVLEGMVARALSTGEPYSLQARIRRPDGTLRHVKAMGEPVRDEAGEISGLAGVFMDVTDVVTADEELRINEARLRFLTENAADLILRIAPKRGVTWISPSARKFGYEPDKLLAKRIFEFVHPDDLAALRTVQRTLLQGVEEERSLMRFRLRNPKSGGWYVFEVNATVVPSQGDMSVEVVNVLRDVTARCTAEAALEDSEARFRQLAETASDIIMRSHPDGRIAYVSPSCERLTGFRPEEVVGRTARMWVHPDDWTTVVTAFQAQLKGGPSAAIEGIEYRLIAKDGRELWMESSPRATVDPATGAVSVTDVVRDITERKALSAALSAAKDAAESAAQVKADFLANMTHELRQPVTAVLGFTAILAARDDLHPAARRSVELVSAASDALLATVNEVLDFSKLEAGLMSIEAKPTHVRERLENALALFEPQARSKGLRLVSAIDPDIPALDLDPDRLRQVLLNFLSNAVKFTDQGEVTLGAEYRASDGVLRVEVRDTGQGLTEDQQAGLFKRFSQVDGAAARRAGGTGLGLAICRGLAEAMGGEVGATSEPGRGSTFWMTISAPPAQAQPRDMSSAESDTLEGLRVLVVDDNASNRELVRSLLTAFGVEVHDAPSGHEAIAAAMVEPVDVILMDLNMPDMGGAEVASQLRALSGPNADVPILAFSAATDVREVVQDSGLFDGYVVKPIDPAALLATISRSAAEMCSSATYRLSAGGGS